jgi:muramoyltetrapeptide carboxypeptidase LdcA involved in peptidoglycan recycling
MKVSKPPKLNDGDTIGVIAPSYPVLPFQEMYDRGIANLKAFGFKVKEGKTVKLTRFGYMAGTDLERAEDINSMFADKEVKAIICAIGGQVAIRTLRYLDYDLIRANPKIFSGMSDITTFHMAFLAKTGLSGLHQTDVVFGFGADMESEGAKYEMDLFFKVAKNPKALGVVPKFTEWEVWRDGRGSGELFGGNIPSMQTLLSTPYFPRVNDEIIFFWECTAKPLDKIDQDLTQFREIGLFDKTVGMVIGKIRGEDPLRPGKVKDMTSEVKKVILEIAGEYDFPIVANVDFGHYTPNIPLPLGLRATVDTEKIEFSINEPYVK